MAQVQPKLARRALLIGGIAAAAAAAASPASACSLTGVRRRHPSYFSDVRARAFLERLIAEANRGERADRDRVEETGIAIHRGPGDENEDDVLLARSWFVSNGRRDDEPAELIGMERLGRGAGERLYLVAIRRWAWEEAVEEDSCFGGRGAGFHRDFEAWLYTFAPESGSALRRVPELDRHIRAFIPDAREALSTA